MKARLSALMLLATSSLAFGNSVELAESLSNPVADLISLPIQSNIDFGIGPGGGTKWTTNVQPVIPLGKKIVPSGHGSHAHPEGIEEARRILLDHANLR